MIYTKSSHPPKRKDLGMESETGEKKSLFHPARPLYRFSLLIFIASLTFGSYFAYDIVGAISPSLVEELGAGRGRRLRFP